MRVQLAAKIFYRDQRRERVSSCELYFITTLAEFRFDIGEFKFRKQRDFFWKGRLQKGADWAKNRGKLAQVSFRTRCGDE